MTATLISYVLKDERLVNLNSYVLSPMHITHSIYPWVDVTAVGATASPAVPTLPTSQQPVTVHLLFLIHLLPFRHDLPPPTPGPSGAKDPRVDSSGWLFIPPSAGLPSQQQLTF